MAPLFWESDADGRREIPPRADDLVADRVLCSGSSVVLDVGGWSPEERYVIRAVADDADADAGFLRSVRQ